MSEVCLRRFHFYHVIKSSVAVFLLCYLTFSNIALAAGPRAAPVVVANAEQVMLAPTVMVSGTVISRQEAEVPAEVDGRLVWVADVGTHLKWGEAVAKLDDTLYRLRVTENKAALRREQSRLKYIRNELARLSELGKVEYAAKSQIEKLQVDRDVSASEVSVIEARLRLDEETLDRFSVRAPFDGVVVARERREGEWVASGDTVVSLSNPSSVEVRAHVSEETINNLKPGDELRVYLGEAIHRGTVRTMVPVGQTQSHLYELRLKVQGNHWRAGQTARVSVPTGQPRSVIAVPRDALVLRRTGNYVFRVNGENQAERVEVKTGIANDSLIAIEGGLSAGDKVVTRGGERLRPGQTVKEIPGS